MEIKEGGGGTVYEAMKLSTKTKVALKRILLKDYDAKFPQNDESVLNEFLLTKDLFRHQNLIDYNACYIIKDAVSRIILIYLEMPLAGKDLSKMIQEKEFEKKPHLLKDLISDTLFGLKYLADMDLFHLDMRFYFVFHVFHLLILP